MATANVRAIPTGGARGLLQYCLDPEAHKDREDYVPGERIQHIQSTLVADKDNIQGMLDEINLQAGDKYECHHLRISLKPGETLTDEDKDKFVEQVMKEYLPDRNFIAVWHGDTEHLHVHILAQFLNTDLKPLSYNGQAKHREAIRRQNIIDKACKQFNLSAVDRNPKEYNPAHDRVKIAEVRMRERGDYLWKDDLKARIRNAMDKAVYTDDYIQELKKNGVHAQINGRGISYSFKAEDGKQHIIRGKALGENFTLQHFKTIRRDYRQESPDAGSRLDAPTRDTSSPANEAHNANGALGSAPSSPISTGNSQNAPAMVKGGVGGAGNDKSLSKEEKEAIKNAQKAEAEIKQAINRSIQSRLEEETKQKKGRGLSR